MANESTAKPRVGLLIGDPCGIGPEDFAKVLAGDQPNPAFDIIVTTGHGTAFDIVGQGEANPIPLARAISIAGMIAQNSDMYASRRA